MTYLTSVADGKDDGGSTTFDSPSLTISGTNKVMWVLAANSDGTPADVSGVVLDPTGVNQSLTQQGSTIAFGSFFKASLWRLIAPSDVTAKIVRVTYAASQAERLVAVWVETGIDQVTPNGTVQTGTTSTPATSIPVSTSAVSTSAGQRVITLAHGGNSVGNFGSTTPFFSPSGTERLDGVLSVGVPYDAWGAQEETASGSTVTSTWTLGNGTSTIDGFAAFSFALNTAGGGSPAVIPLMGQACL